MQCIDTREGPWVSQLWGAPKALGPTCTRSLLGWELLLVEKGSVTLEGQRSAAALGKARRRVCVGRHSVLPMHELERGLHTGTTGG